MGQKGFFKTRPHRQVLGSVLFSEAGSRIEAGRPMQQAKYVAPLPALPGYECVVGGLHGPAGALSRFGAGRATRSFSAQGSKRRGGFGPFLWPRVGQEQPGGSHTRGGNYTADGPAEPHYLVLISIRNGWARATCSVSAGSGEGTASRAPALVASRIHSFGNRLASFSPPPLAGLL